jgi:selenocysteine lyase/cysteine desulfurase
MTVDTNRRRFLQTLAVGSVVHPLLAGRPAAAQSHTGEGPEALWEEVRRQFAFRDERVPMNAANLCPSPRVVAERVSELTRDIDVDCSFPNRAKFGPLLEKSREAVALQLGVTADEIALVRNTSEANNVVNAGIPLDDGDEVVVWDQNHPTNNVAWKVRAQRRGFSLREVEIPPNPSDPDELIRPFREALTPRTRVLALTHASNVSGVLLPVRELCEFARRSGIYVHVDGAQTWGALELDLHELGCDSFAASAHKWYCGPKEVGLLYVRRERVPEIWPSTVAPGWGEEAETELAGARKFESMGQRDDAAISAMREAAGLHSSIGTDRVERRVRELSSLLKQSLAATGATLVTPLDDKLSAGVCIMQVAPEKRQAVFDAMYDRFGIAGSTSGGFRLCPHVYNTREHIERAVRGVASIRPLWA